MDQGRRGHRRREESIRARAEGWQDAAGRCRGDRPCGGVRLRGQERGWPGDKEI